MEMERDEGARVGLDDVPTSVSPDDPTAHADDGDESTVLGEWRIDSGDDSALGTELEMDADEEDFPREWTLETIPKEMFLHICSFIDAGFLIHRMNLVCRQFHEIIANEQTWKIRQRKRWGANGSYPPVPVNEDEFPWSRACVKREEQIKLWGNNGSNLRNVELRGHIACVDAVHLFEGGKYLASGSRDRSIVIWDVEKCLSSPNPAELHQGGEVTLSNSIGKVETKSAAHTGWIWSIASNAAHLLSASWDCKVKIWDRKSEFQLVAECPTKSPALALSAMENLVACGTSNSKILLFDPRSGTLPVTSFRAHRMSVLALGMDENRVISCGEDGKVVSYDLRQRQIQKSFSLPDPLTYPTCLSFRREDPASLFYIGDKNGNIHLISNDLEIIKSYDVGHKRSIQGVFHGLGSIFTCSRDGNMKIFEPSSGLKEIASYSINEELPAVHSLYNTVALADGNGVVRLWSPVEGF